MFPVSNHSYCETSTNTVKSSLQRTAVLVCETRIAMRSVVTQQVAMSQPISNFPPIIETPTTNSVPPDNSSSSNDTNAANQSPTRTCGWNTADKNYN